MILHRKQVEASARVRAWCCEALEGWTTREVAGLLGVRWNTVADWKSGEHEPSGSTLVLISELTGHPLGALDRKGGG